MIFATISGGEGRRPGGQPKNWHRCLVEDLRVFRAKERSTEHCPLVFGVEIAVWTIADKKAGKWYRGVLDADERFMVRFMVRGHKDEADMSRKRHASAVGSAKGHGKGGATVMRRPRLAKAGRRQRTG